MNRKGVCYDVGRVMMGENWRPKFDPQIVHRELGIIRNDLHCNTVRVCGLDIDRLMAASEDALAQGLEVWLSPEMWDREQDETLGYITKAAVRAEKLRQRWPGRLIFSVGSELTLFMKGIVEGENVFERINNPSFSGSLREGRHNAALNAFLASASKAVRQVFHGQTTYFSVPLEAVDWGPFDFVGVDLYRDAGNREAYGGMAKAYQVYRKPVVIGEFGCYTYQGAEKLGANGFMVMFGMMEEYLGPKVRLPKPIFDMVKIPPRVDGHYIRDEGLQARELVDQLGVLDAAGTEGAFVCTFVSANTPYNKDQRFDSDMVSLSLVKSYPQKESVEEWTRQVISHGKELLGVDLDPSVLAKFNDEVGKHGQTYPEMSWEPKESFRAVADYYANH